MSRDHLLASVEGGRRHLRTAGGVALFCMTVVFCAALAGTVKVASAESGESGRGVAQRPSSAPTQTVLFCSNVPQTKISLKALKNNQVVSERPLGTTKAKAGKEGGFLVDLPLGNYEAIGEKQGYKPGIYPFNVSVRQSQPEICVHMTEEAAPRTTPTPTPTPPPTTPPPPKPKTALERFTDPKESDQVKAEDWNQFLPGVYAQLGVIGDDPKLTAQAQFARGRIQFLSGDYAKALAIYNGIDVPKSTSEYTLVLYAKGAAYDALKQYDKAEAACREIVSGSQDTKLLWLGRKCLGDVYSSQGKKEKAEEEYAEARKLGYERAGGGLDSLRKLVEKGGKSGAREALPGLRALAEKERSGEAYTLLGKAYDKDDKKASAYKAYSDAVTAYLEKRRGARPETAAAEALYEVGEVDLKENNTEKGWIHITCALELDPEAKFIDREKATKKAKEAYNKLEKRPGGFTRPAEPCGLLVPTPARP